MRITCLALCLALTACRLPSKHYKEHHDYESLETLAREIHVGLPKKAVIDLLGEPIYSPIDGQVYYDSDRTEKMEGDIEGTLTLVIDYRTGLISQGGNGDTVVTDRVQVFSLGPVGE